LNLKKNNKGTPLEPVTAALGFLPSPTIDLDHILSHSPFQKVFKIGDIFLLRWNERERERERERVEIFSTTISNTTLNTTTDIDM
jgi:hypothetical protein